MDVGAVPVRRLHQHAGRVLVDLGARAAHHPGDRGRPVGVGDQHHLLVERARLAVERLHGLAGSRQPDGQLGAGDPVEVERVQRLAGQQHHVVGDVDHVRDRALAGGHQPRLQPRRRGADLDVLEHARGEARAQLRALDGDPHAIELALAARVLAPGRERERGAGRGVDLAGDPVDRQAVGAVRRDLEHEHVGRDRQHALERHARLEPARLEHHDPVVLDADRELVLGEDHPVRLLAAELGDLQLRAVGHHGAGLRRPRPSGRRRRSARRRRSGSARPRRCRPGRR